MDIHWTSGLEKTAKDALLSECGMLNAGSVCVFRACATLLAFFITSLMSKFAIKTSVHLEFYYLSNGFPCNICLDEK